MNFIPVTDVQLEDPLWSKQFDLVRNVVVPHMWKILNGRIDDEEKTSCIENFKIAAGLSAAQYHGPIFGDSDLYKWIEAASYCLAVENDNGLDFLVDQVIDLINAAQQPDGYLNTYFTVVAPDKRWKNLMEGHELYCAGHLIEAAVAHHQVTRKNKLLEIACRFADHINLIFGTDKRRGYPGHPEIELALIRLYEVTHEGKYLSLAGYFINERGVGNNIFEEEREQAGNDLIFPEMAHFKADYFQSHLPVREQRRVTGHAVRAMYLYSGIADYARLTNDLSLIEACERLYENTVSRQMYVTGGVGSACLGEGFTVDFDLPSDSAYAESCASVGLMLFSSRMWLLNPRKYYYDIWEQVLHNNILSGMGRDGKHFFYVNPLEVVPQTVSNNPSLSHVKTQRQEWFTVACCPPNLARILTSLHGYIYALDGDRLYILSHIGSSFEKGGLYVNLSLKDNEYTLTIDGGKVDVFLRLPENSALVGNQFQMTEDGFFTIHHVGGREQYSYSLKPLIRILRAHPSVSSLAGKVCVQRGPTLYCVEGADNAVPLSALRLPADAIFTEEKAEWIEEELPVIKSTGYKVSDAGWEKKLYSSEPCEFQPYEITFIPYSHWGNRGENEMRVWLNEI